MVKQIKVFHSMEELEQFLPEHPDAQILKAPYFAINRQIKNIISFNDKKNITIVPRPSEKPYKIMVIYVVYESDGFVQKGVSTKAKTFSASEDIGVINEFLASHHVEKIEVIPVTEKTGPLDSYCIGEYGPVPDRTPAYADSHKLLVIYSEWLL